MADARKTALGAIGLALLAAWFAASGGPADNAVSGAAALAQRQNANPEPAASPAPGPATGPATGPTPQPTPASWFAPDKDADLPPIDTPPDRIGDADDHLDPTAIYRPQPTGPDFPPGNR